MKAVLVVLFFWASLDAQPLFETLGVFQIVSPPIDEIGVVNCYDEMLVFSSIEEKTVKITLYFPFEKYKVKLEPDRLQLIEKGTNVSFSIYSPWGEKKRVKELFSLLRDKGVEVA